MEVDYGLWQENGLNISVQYWIVVSRWSDDHQLLLPYVQRDSVHVAPSHISRLSLVYVWAEKIVSFDLFFNTYWLLTTPIHYTPLNTLDTSYLRFS